MCKSNSLMDSHPLETLNSQQILQDSTSPVSSTNDNLGERKVANAENVMEVPGEDIKEDPESNGDDDDYINERRMIYSTHWSAPWNSYGYRNRSSLAPERSPSPEKKSCREKSPSPHGSRSPDFSTYVVAPNKRSLVGAGLVNLGNTCFLNAILQCFTHTMLFVQELCFSDHNCGSGHFCLLCSLRHHIELALTSSGKIVSPWCLVENLSSGKKSRLSVCKMSSERFSEASRELPDTNKLVSFLDFSSSFRRYHQEDAHEFLQCLLDRLENCYLDSRTQNKEMLLQDDNLVKRIFGGRLISKLLCCNCGYHSDTYESFIDISLEIEHANSLEMALASFTKAEKIDCDTKFNCQNCKEYVSVEKQLMLDQVPPVAALHLKRFKNDGSWVEKIDKHVKFDMDLDLLPYTCGRSENGRAMTYELYAMVVHSGCSPTSGHYVSFIRSSPDTWYELDDSTVMLVDENWVLCQKAYILFYAKEGTPWLSSMLDTSPKYVLESMDIVCAPNQIIESSYNLNVREIEHIGEETSTHTLAESRHEIERMPMENAKGDSHIIGMAKPFHKEVNNDEMEVKEDKNNSQSDNTQQQYEETRAKSFLFEVNCREVTDTASVLHGTPSRYQKPEVDLRKVQEATCIRRNAEKEKSLKDTKRKEAFRTSNLLSIPVSRKLKYLAPINQSSNRKNRRRKALSLKRKARSPAFCRLRSRHRQCR